MRDRPPLARTAGLAALAGGFAVAGLARSPWWALVPPAFVPYVPVDLRVLVPFMVVVGATAASRPLPWPGPALVPASAALGFAVVARLPASTVLVASGFPGARGGLAADPLGLAASLGAVLVGLQVGLEAARWRAAGRLRTRGIPEGEARALAREGRDLARSSLAAATLVAGGLVVALATLGGLVAGRTLPLAEVAGFVLVLAVVAVASDWRGVPLGG